MRNSLLQSLAFAFAFLPGKVFARDGSNTMGAQEREHVSVGNNAAGSQFSVERHLGSVAHSIWDGAQHRKLLWGSGTVGRRGAWPQRETMDASHMSCNAAVNLHPTQWTPVRTSQIHWGIAPDLPQPYEGLQGVAYSPRLWLISCWRHKLYQCQKS
eukprot:scaffold100900_cov18-Tisochrysis_lutea.AAC.1